MNPRSVTLISSEAGRSSCSCGSKTEENAGCEKRSAGSDEFIALLEGEDYASQEDLLKQFEKQIMENKEKNKIVVAFGSSRFDPDKDESIITVFERADENMYQKKKELKNTPSKAA